MDFKQAISEFGHAVKNLKESYAEEFYKNSNYVMLIVDSDNYLSIMPTNDSGAYCDTYREWVG